MSILVNRHTRVITQGITGATGLFHAQGARDYGTQMVGGVTPGKGGTTIDGFPVFNTVRRLYPCQSFHAHLGGFHSWEPPNELLSLIRLASRQDDAAMPRA